MVGQQGLEPRTGRLWVVSIHIHRLLLSFINYYYL